MHAGAKGIICSEGEEGDEEPSEAKLFEIIAYMEMQINATKNSSIFIMRQVHVMLNKALRKVAVCMFQTILTKCMYYVSFKTCTPCNVWHTYNLIKIV